MTSNLPDRRDPGESVERRPKPTALRILFVLAGLAAPALVIWDLSTATSAEMKEAGLAPLAILVGSLYVTYWFIEKANEDDVTVRSLKVPPATDTKDEA